MKLKYWNAIFLIVIIFMLFTACRKSTKEIAEQKIDEQITQRSLENKSNLSYSDKIPIVAIISKYVGDPILDQIVQSAKNYLEKRNIHVIIKSPVSCYESTYSQNLILTECIESEVDGIILIPSDDIMLNKNIKRALEAGIDIVIPDTMINIENAKTINMPVNKLSFVILDNYKEFNETLNDYFLTLKGEYRAIIISGDLKNPNAVEREAAARDAISNTSNINLLGSFDGLWQEDAAYHIVEEQYKVFPDINLIIACNDRMALGSIVYLKENNLVNKVKVIGFDASAGGRAAIDDGTMDLTIYQDLNKFGELSAEIMINKLHDMHTLETYYITTEIITKD